MLTGKGFYYDRFEPFSRRHTVAYGGSIDWVQDAARAQLQRRISRKDSDGFFRRGGGATGWRRKLYESYNAGQAWIVITIIGWRCCCGGGGEDTSEGSYRCRHRSERFLSEYRHRVAGGYQARSLHHGVLLEREILLLGG